MKIKNFSDNSREEYTQRISSCGKARAQSSSAVYIPVHEQRDKRATKPQLESRRVYKQFFLDLRLDDSASLANFYAADNEKALTLLQSLKSETKKQFIYLWGHQGVGRSHLLMASCRKITDFGLPVAYLALKEQKNLAPEILENLEDRALLCLDDLDQICGQLNWEEALFHCFNRLQEAGGNLIVSANAPPSALNFILPDLKSRFTSCLIFKLKPLTDTQKLAALELRADWRGLKLAPDVARFLLHHYPRDLNNLFAMLEKLAKAALQSKRSLTIPFIKEVLT